MTFKSRVELCGGGDGGGGTGVSVRGIKVADEIGSVRMCHGSAVPMFQVSIIQSSQEIYLECSAVCSAVCSTYERV